MFAATNPRARGGGGIVPFVSSVSANHLPLAQRRGESTAIHRSKSHPLERGRVHGEPNRARSGGARGNPRSGYQDHSSIELHTWVEGNSMDAVSNFTSWLVSY